MKTRLPLRFRPLLAALVAGLVAALGVPADSEAQRALNPQDQAMAEAQSLWRNLNGGLDSLADSLSLSADQKERITVVADEFRAANTETLARWTALQRKMRELLASRDRAAIGQARREWGDKYGNPVRELAPAFAVLKEGVEAVLNADQREKLDALVRRGVRRRPRG